MRFKISGRFLLAFACAIGGSTTAVADAVNGGALSTSNPEAFIDSSNTANSQISQSVNSRSSAAKPTVNNSSRARTVDVTAIPEPATLILIGSGLGFAGLILRRRLSVKR